MSEAPSLFHGEESIIAACEEILASAHGSVPLRDYRRLVDQYRKLYRQSKRLVKMGDRMQRELENLARRDGLTGLWNRKCFMEMGAREIHRADRMGAHLSLVYFDVDHFKSVNDTYGHEAGDLVLVELARIVACRIRRTDIPGRLGGEEFAILMPDTAMDGAARVAEELRKAIAGHGVATDRGRLRCTASFGIACHDSAHGGMEKLIRAADNSMYAAKKSGRNRVNGL